MTSLVTFQDVSYLKGFIHTLSIYSALGGGILFFVVLLLVTISLATKTWSSSDGRLIALTIAVLCLVFVVGPMLGNVVQYVVHRTIPTRYFTYNQIEAGGDVYTFSNRFSQRSVTVKKQDIVRVVITYERAPDQRWPGQYLYGPTYKYFAWVKFTNGRKISTPVAHGYFPSPEKLSDAFHQVGLSDLVQISPQPHGPDIRSEERLFSLGSLTYHNINQLASIIIILVAALYVWPRIR